MATYIKGADTYLPDIKPFTPDYKFLSAVLETRKDKYDSNFKATNDIYNKVVYSDLSREDNRIKRDQYAENIAPQIERISGLDLSLQQNADAAQSIFAPFYDDDLIVSDIVHTSQYRKQSEYANRLLESGTAEGADRYSESGVASLNYKMDDYINASPEKAMAMAAPNYVDGVNLFNMSQDILSEMDLSMEMDMGVTADGKYMIRQKNGALITGAIEEVLKQTLLKDPRVIAAYADDAFVASRNFAQGKIQDGSFRTVEEAQGAWANEQIARINELNNIDLNDTAALLAAHERVNVTWQNYVAKNGMIPGSDLDVAMQGEMSAAEATKLALESKMDLQRVGGIPTQSIPGTLNKAYNMIMSYNLGNDISIAAQTHAAQDQSYILRTNEYELQNQKFKNDLAKIAAQAENARNLAMEKGELIGFTNGNPLVEAATAPTVVFNAATGFEAAIDEEGEIDQNANLLEVLDENIVIKNNELMQDKLQDVLSMFQLLNPKGTGPDKDHKYDIQIYDKELGLKDYRGTIAEIEKVLGFGEATDVEGVLKYNNREVINSLFESTSKIFGNTAELTKTNPELTIGTDTRTQYDKLYNKIFGLDGTITREAGINQAILTSKQHQLNAYKIIEAAAITEGDEEYDSDVRLLMEAGYPSIVDELGSVIPIEDYANLVKDLIRQNKVKNVDIGGFDYGTDNEDYMIPETKLSSTYSSNPYVMQTQYMPMPQYNDDGSPKMKIDERAVMNDVVKIHKKLSGDLQRILRSGDVPSGNLIAALNGDANAAADMSGNPSITFTLNPLINSEGTIEAQKEMNVILQQLQTMDQKGVNYGIVAGDINNVEDDNLLIKEPVAIKAWNLAKQDIALAYNDPKAFKATGKNVPILKIVYHSVYGRATDGDKTNSAYQILFPPEWLASYADGTNTKTSEEIGALSKDDINLLSGNRKQGSRRTEGDGTAGISIIFPQAEDINPKGKKNNYVSYVETAILNPNNGGTDFATFKVPDGLENSNTEYSITKIGRGNYTVNYDLKTYVPGGTYTTQNHTYPLPSKNTKNLKNLDAAIKELHAFFVQHRSNNIAAQQKDVATNGTK